MNPQLSAWAPVVSAGIVGLTSVFGLWLVQWKTSQREYAAKEREAKEKRANRWDDFQMKTLMDLQDAIKRMAGLPRRMVEFRDAESLRVLGIDGDKAS